MPWSFKESWSETNGENQESLNERLEVFWWGQAMDKMLEVGKTWRRRQADECRPTWSRTGHCLWCRMDLKCNRFHTGIFSGRHSTSPKLPTNFWYSPRSGFWSTFTPVSHRLPDGVRPVSLCALNLNFLFLPSVSYIFSLAVTFTT